MPTQKDILSEIEAQVDFGRLDGCIQHLTYLLEGYRSRALCETQPGTEDLSECPYSPGSARQRSWATGWEMAGRDLEGLQK